MTMLFTFRNVSIFTIIIFFATLSSCTKTLSQKGASKAAGTYKGYLRIRHSGTTTTNEYDDFRVKVEHTSKEKIQISSISSPEQFKSAEVTVSLANNTIESHDNVGVDFWYQSPSTQMKFAITSASFTASFSGNKE